MLCVRQRQATSGTVTHNDRVAVIQVSVSDPLSFAQYVWYCTLLCPAGKAGTIILQGISRMIYFVGEHSR